MEQNTPETTSTGAQKPTPPWMIPVSVIVAGLLIGAAIFFRPSAAPATQKVATEAQVKQEIAAVAKDIGVQKVGGDTCFTEENKALVQEDIDSGNRIGVNGTPFLVFEFVTKDNIETFAVPGAIPREAIEQILKDKKLPEGFPNTPLKGYTYANDKDHATSSLEGKTVRIVEYSDLDCPYCKRIHPVLESVVADHPEVVWIYRHFPIPNLHPNAPLKAQASECIAKTGGNDAFWKFIRDIMAE